MLMTKEVDLKHRDKVTCDFVLPSDLIGRFAIVKLWPEIKTAEDECIARLKIAAANLGLECIEIHADGRIVKDPEVFITKKDVDFVFHLHYDTPKLYDAFSFVALWNPIQFYHEWGYSRTSRNLLTHDDFLSCSSVPADDHVGRLIRRSSTHFPPLFSLYHSVDDIVYPPSLGEQKLFYAGINWEALSGGSSRHQKLLKRLDKTGNLRIFGPTIFQGVRVWGGYESYVKEIPFDGISMIDEIAKVGISLVLSSKAHKESELMSNRLFESVAAGSLVICDENNFAKKFFGDSLLYIDSRRSVDKIFDDIKNHLVWANKNSDEALAMIEKSQRVFRQKFSLKNNLSDLYNGFTARKLELRQHHLPEDKAQIKVCLYMIISDYSDSVLKQHIDSVAVQEYKQFIPVLVVDKKLASKNRSCIEEYIAKSTVTIHILEVDFFTYGITDEIRRRRKFGAVIADILAVTSQVDAVVFVAPNERIFSNHLQVLAGSLMRNREKNCAATSSILIRNGMPVHQVHENIDFRQLDPLSPMGYARFIFRFTAFPGDLNLALRYLDRKAMAILVGEGGISFEIPSTVILYLDHEFPSGLWNEGQENELISSFCPTVFKIFNGSLLSLPPLSSPPSFELGVFRLGARLLSWHFLSTQVRLLREYGLTARIKVLKRKFRIKLRDLFIEIINT